MDEQAKVCREKYWSELVIEEKIERMRDIVRQKDRMLSELWAMVEQMRFHVHSEHDGRILHDPSRSSYGMVTGGGERLRTEKDNEVFF